MLKILISRNCLVVIVILKNVFARSSYLETGSGLTLKGKYNAEKHYVDRVDLGENLNNGEAETNGSLDLKEQNIIHKKGKSLVDAKDSVELNKDSKNNINAVLTHKGKADTTGSGSVERTELNKNSKKKYIVPHNGGVNTETEGSFGSREQNLKKKLNVTNANSGEETSNSSVDSKEDLKKRLQVESVAEKTDNRNEQWPLGVVPYYVDQDSYDGLVGERVRLAMNTIEDASCVQFKALIEPQNDFPWIHITNPTRERRCVHEADSNSNASGIVMVLGLDCMHRSDILHSLMHALGFKDEVTHPQRDQYVRIKWDNIQPQYRSLFHISYDERRTAEYDPASIMHFHDRAFTKNGQATIATLVPGLMITPSKDLSPLDKMKLRLMFGHECNRRKVGDFVDVCKAALQAEGDDTDHGKNQDSVDKHDDNDEGNGEDRNKSHDAGDNSDDPNNDNGVHGGDEGNDKSDENQNNNDNESQDGDNKDGNDGGTHGSIEVNRAINEGKNSMTDEEDEKETTKIKLRRPSHPPVTVQVG